jgi:hypothetical protein
MREPTPLPEGITLDTAGTGQGHRRLSLFAPDNDGRRFLPIHVSDQTPITAS